MIKTKVLGLVLAGTVAGAGIGAALVSQINANTQKATTEITESADNLKLAGNAIDTAQTTIEKKNKRIEDMGKTNADIIQSWGEALKQLEAANNTIKENTATIENLEKELKASQENVTKLQTELDKANTDIATKNDQIDSLLKDLAEAKNKNVELQGKLDEVNKQLAEKEQSIKDLTAKVSELEAQIEKDNATSSQEMKEVQAAVNSQTSNLNRAVIQSDESQANFEQKLNAFNDFMENQTLN